jgi:SM-20-related protein
MTASDVFDMPAFAAMPLNRDPYDYLIVPKFVRPDVLPKINADYPQINDTGSLPLSGLKYGPNFQAMVDGLESPEFRHAFEKKFGIDLTGRPSTITARGRCAQHDGSIHTDSKSKIITVLLYLNPKWDNSGGQLRLLRSGNNIEDYAAEVCPAEGTLLAFLRSDRSWHGHLPFAGERRVIQFNWVTSKGSQRMVMIRHGISGALKRVLGKINAGSDSKQPVNM